MKTRNYNALPALRDPWLLFRSMARDLRASSGLAWRLALRNLDGLYRRSALGYLWIFIPPLFTAAVFVALRSGGVFADPSGTVPYAAFALCGLLLWQCFADGFLAPLRMMRQSLSVLPKLHVPGEALLLAALFDSLIQALIRMALVGLVLAIFKVSPGLPLALFPAAVCALVFTGLAFGILLAPFAVLYEDIERSATLLLPLWMLVSGVVVAAPTENGIGGILAWNPVTPVLSWARNCLFDSEISGIAEATAVVAVCAALGLAAWVIYRVALPHVIARIPQ